MVKLRKILFFIFTVLYIVLCPALILSSLGIVIKPGHGTKNVVKTGIIYVSSIPSGALVVLNGKPTNGQTPTVINNLPPGIYTLEVTAKNYQPWKTTVTVAAETATPLEGILLIPQFLNIVELSSIPFNTLIPVAGNPYLIATNGPNVENAFVHIWDEGITQNLIPDDETKVVKLKPLFPADFDQRTARIVRWHTINNSPYLLVEIEANGNKRFLWIDPLFGTPKIEDITDLFPVAPEEIQWAQNDARHLLTFQNNTINRIDIATKAIYPKVIDHAAAFSQFEQTIFFLTEDKTLKKANANGNNQELLSKNPVFNDLVASHFPFEKIIAVADNVVVLLGQRGEVLCNLKPYFLTESGIEGFKWNEKPQRLMLWSKNKIGFIDFSKRPQDVAPKVTWITDKAENIANAFWVNEGSHVLFVDNNQIFIADTGCCGPPGVQKIMDVAKGTSIYYTDRIEKIFFTDKDTKHLFSAEMHPQKTLRSVVNFEQRAKKAEPIQ